MKLINLNIWGGRMYEPLKEFINRNSGDVDVFCFQEVRKGKLGYGVIDPEERETIFDDLRSLLKDFNSYYYEQVPGVGSATFVKNNIGVKDVGGMTIIFAKELEHLNRPDSFNYYPRIMQFVKFDDMTIYNFHGVPGSNKADIPERKLQNERIKDILMGDNNRKIIVGDFNLDLKTEAISEFEGYMRNLIKENDIKTTRNNLYKNYIKLPFSDYIFATYDIEVINFKLLHDEVSDHLPLLLEFK